MTGPVKRKESDGLEVLATAGEAVTWANGLIASIEAAGAANDALVGSARRSRR